MAAFTPGRIAQRKVRTEGKRPASVMGKGNRITALPTKENLKAERLQPMVVQSNRTFVRGAVKPIPDDILEPPLNLGATAIVIGQVDLTWDDALANSNPTVEYRIFRDDLLIATVMAPATTYVDAAGPLLIPPDTAVRYTVDLLDNKVNRSILSLPFNAAIPNLVLAAAPLAPTLAPLDQTTLRVSWIAPAAGTFPIASYNIYRNGVAVDNVAVTQLDTVIPYNDYGWRVSAIDDQGNEGPLSDETDALWYGLLEVNHWDEGGKVGAFPIVSWTDNIGGVVINVIDGVINQVLKNGVPAIETEGEPGRMVTDVQVLLLNDYSQIMVGGLIDNVGIGNEFLFDGRANSNRRLFWGSRPADNTLFIGIAGGTLELLGEEINADLVAIVSRDVADGRVFTYQNNVVTRIQLDNGFDYEGLRIFSDNAGAAWRWAPADSWAGEIVIFDYVLSADQRLFWTDYLRNKWGV